jgi:hypothetical protein
MYFLITFRVMFKLLVKENNISEATGVNMFPVLKRKNDTTTFS